MTTTSLSRLIRALLVCVVLAVMLVMLLAVAPAHGQGVEAEAIGQANLRAGPGIEYAVVGEIRSGTRYAVIGRSARFPWYLLQLPDRQGWVFKDLVQVYGNINAVAFSEAVLDVSPAPTLTPVSPTVSDPGQTNTAATLTPSATQAPAGATAEAISIANVRYGPGTDFPRIGEIRSGESYAVLRRHTSFNWIEIAFPEVAGGRGWVSRDVVNISGNLNSVTATDARDFGYPTLTPTPIMVVTDSPPWLTPVPSSAAPSGKLGALGSLIYNYLLGLDFVPGTPRQASAFLLDLQTGESVSLNPRVAYSGVSIIKIGVIIALFRKIPLTPLPEQAQLMAEMIICSENLSSNALLRYLGDGDEYRGAQYVTETLRLLGLKDSFLIRSFFTGASTPGPTPTEQPFVPVTTDADQRATSPDPSNQTTPAEIGWLLSGIYQCAKDGSGPLTAAFPGDVDVLDCRRMMRVLRATRFNAMSEAGLPDGVDGVVVAHKVGYSEETHGDAAIIFTPGGDFILVVMLYNRQRLDYQQSFPAISEITRALYNAYNPAQPLGAIKPWAAPLCSIDMILERDPALLNDLQAPDLPWIR